MTTTTETDLATRRARFVHEGVRAYGIAAHAPVVRPIWEEREPEAQLRFTTFVNTVCHLGPLHSPAENHDAWMSDQASVGWTYGPVLDNDAKTHPNMVPWHQLPQSEQAKDTVVIQLCELARDWIN